MSQSMENLTEGQKRTMAARRALAQGFSSPAERREFYRQLGRKSSRGRVLLSGDEAAALVDAYSLLGRIAERARIKLGDAPNEAA